MSKISTSSKSVSGDNEDELTCQICTEVFTSPDDRLMECERCDNWFCAKCLKMSAEVYGIMVNRKDVHWFCSACEKAAIMAVKCDKEIEEKCAAYMSSITDKIVNIEEQLRGKADKSSLKELDTRLKCLEDKGGARPKGSETQSGAVREAIAEQQEREYRLKNIVILNLPESKKKDIKDKIKDDKALVEKVMAAIEIEEEEVITRCVRITNRDREDKKGPRILKVSVNSVETKKKILKSAKKLKDIREFENVFIGPDLTRMQREEQYLLRKRLNERKANGEKDIFISRGKIVHARERAVQFKGGAARPVKK